MTAFRPAAEVLRDPLPDDIHFMDARAGDIYRMLNDSAPYEASATGVAPIAYDPGLFRDIPLLPRVRQSPLEVMAATRELVAGLYDNMDPTSILDLAANLGCYIRDKTGTRLLFRLQDAQGTQENSKISLISPGWWDSNKALPADDSTLVRLYSHLKTARETDVCLWGPWFALIVLRTEKRSAWASGSKMANLAGNITRVYGVNLKNVPNFGNPDAWREIFSPFSSHSPDSATKHTLLKSLIMYYNSADRDSTTAGILDFAILQSIRYTGMTTLTLVRQVCDLYNLKLNQLMPITSSTNSLVSWQNLSLITRKFLDNRSPEFNDKIWHYIKEFYPECFQELTFLKNQWLCTICALILDIAKNPDQFYTPQHPGPTYLGLTSFREQIKKAGVNDYSDAYKIYDYLEDQYSAKPSTSIFESIRNRPLRQPNRQPHLPTPEPHRDPRLVNIDI